MSDGARSMARLRPSVGARYLILVLLPRPEQRPQPGPRSRAAEGADRFEVMEQERAVVAHVEVLQLERPDAVLGVKAGSSTRSIESLWGA